MKTLKWLKKEEVNTGLSIDNGWIKLGDDRIRVSSISAFRKYENGNGEFLIGIISGGKWYTAYRTESRVIRDKNFDLFEQFMLDKE